MTEKSWREVIFTSRKLLRIARKAANRSKKERDQALVAILFSAAAVEGFINDVLEFSALIKGDEKVNTLAALLQEAEQQKAQIALKLQLISSVFRQTPLKKGERLYQDFDLLFKLRNSLVHMKPDRGNGSFYVPARKPHHANQLVKRGIITKENADKADSWLDMISTPEVAQWACSSAQNVSLEIYDMTSSPLLRDLLYRAWADKNGNISSITVG